MAVFSDKNKIGLSVLTDEMQEVDTVTVVFGVRTGSRNEDISNNGISHFLEHMAFKGTKNRSYLKIAEEIDNIGGSMNAYTSKERTLYYIKVMKEDLETAIDILADIIQNSIFLDEEIEKERGVILQELAAGLDTPDDVVFDYFYRTAFGDSPLGREIIGTAENIKRFKKADFNDYINARYSVSNSVLSVCGNVKHGDVMNISDKYFTELKDININSDIKSPYHGGLFTKNNDDLEQMQCVIGFKSIDYHDKNIYTVSALNTILSSGMSSRLFQEIREKRGLVYTISSWNDSYNDDGVFTFYAGTSPEKVDELLIALKGEIQKICSNIDDIEIHRMIKQNTAGLVMSQESTSARAKKLCTDYLHFGRHITYSEIVDKISSVTKDDIINMGKQIFSSKPSIAFYGKLNDIKTDLKTWKI